MNLTCFFHLGRETVGPASQGDPGVDDKARSACLSVSVAQDFWVGVSVLDLPSQAVCSPSMKSGIADIEAGSIAENKTRCDAYSHLLHLPPEECWRDGQGRRDYRCQIFAVNGARLQPFTAQCSELAVVWPAVLVGLAVCTRRHFPTAEDISMPFPCGFWTRRTDAISILARFFGE
jgi:hypothetical protein